MNSNVKLYDALKSSYGDKRARQELSNAGYKYDSMLSNHNQQVWFNPSTRHLLYNVAGTHNISDIGTDLYLGLGKLKDTNRYKQAKTILDQAKTKYSSVQPIKTSITGHSLGGAVAQYIGSKDDNILTLDKGATIGQKTRSNENAFRSQGDLVSALNANSTRMNTLNQNNKGLLNYLNPLASHDVSNIKNENIFV